MSLAAKESLHSLNECQGRLWPVEKGCVFGPPRFELDAFPALWQVFLKDWQSVPQLATTEHVRIQVAPLAGVRTKHPPAERSLEMLEGFHVPPMKFDLKRRPGSITGEGTFTNDQPHRIA